MRIFNRLRGAGVVLLTTVILAGCGLVSSKTVVRKDMPNTLVADDGSICIVSKERFEKTEIGMKAICGWRGATTQFIRK